MSAETDFVTFLEDIDFDVFMDATVGVGVGFHAGATPAVTPCGKCVEHEKALALFRGIYSRLEAYENGAVIPSGRI